MARKRDLLALLGVGVVSGLFSIVVFLNSHIDVSCGDKRGGLETRIHNNQNIDKLMMENMMNKAKDKWALEKAALEKMLKDSADNVKKAKERWTTAKKQLQNQLKGSGPSILEASSKTGEEKQAPEAAPKEKADDHKLAETKKVTDEKNIKTAKAKQATKESAKKETTGQESEGEGNHEGASPAELEDKGECGDQSHDPAENGLRPPTLISEEGFKKGERPDVRWAVVFPYHGNKGILVRSDPPDSHS